MNVSIETLEFTLCIKNKILRIKDIKDGKINKIIVHKLNRLTRSIKDLEEICKFLK